MKYFRVLLKVQRRSTLMNIKVHFILHFHPWSSFIVLCVFLSFSLLAQLVCYILHVLQIRFSHNSHPAHPPPRLFSQPKKCEGASNKWGAKTIQKICSLRSQIVSSHIKFCFPLQFASSPPCVWFLPPLQKQNPGSALLGNKYYLFGEALIHQQNLVC